jgi:hypothetical protein
MIETTITCEKCGAIQESVAYLAQHLKTMHGLSAVVAIELAKEMRARTEGTHSAAKAVMAWLQDNPDCLGIELLFRIEEAIEEQNKLLRKENAQLRQALQQIAGIAGNLSDEAVQKVGGINDARRWALAVVHARQIARSLLAPAHPTPAREDA